MRNIEIDKTFSAIRMFPAELDYSDIENWVLKQPLSPISSNQFIRWLNARNLLIGIMTISLVSLSLFFNIRVTKKSSPDAVVSVSQPHPSLKTGNLSLKDKTSNSIPVKPATAPVLTRNTLPPQLPEDGNSKQMQSSSISNDNTRIEPPPGVPSPVPPLEKKSTVSFDKECQLAEPDDDAPLRVRTYSSTFCTFGDDDVWIKAFVRELIKDGFIKDTVNLRFTLTGKWFKVNGKMMDESIATKYRELYNSATGEKLLPKSSLSLSVNEGSCSLSKSINEE